MGEDVQLCEKCKKDCKKKEDRINCDFCENLFHLNCVNIAPTNFTCFKRIEGASWHCKDCIAKKDFAKSVFSRLNEIETILKEHTSKLMSNENELKNVQQKLSSGQLSSAVSSPFVSAQGKRSFAMIAQTNVNGSPYTYSDKMNEVSKKRKKVDAKKNILYVKPKEKSGKDGNDAKVAVKNILSQNSDPVNGLKALKNGKLIVECKDADAANSVKQKLNEKMADAYDVVMGEKNWPKILILGIEEDYANDQEFIKALTEKNDSITEDSVIKVVKVYGSNNPIKKAVIETDIKTFENVMQRKSVIVGWNICTALEFVNVKMCYNCLGYGHLASNCNFDRACSKCSGPHKSDECTETTFSCINCKRFNRLVSESDRIGENHPVFSVKCPLYKKKLNYRRNNVQYSD